MILSGRGFGKNWVGAHWINECARSGEDEHIALVGRDASDVRKFMVEGPTGILPLAPANFQPVYFASRKLIIWPNGCKAHIYYAEEPKTIRGPNHSKAWCDEVASWQDAHLGQMEDTAWSNLMMTMRVAQPRVLVTSTPKPLKLIKQLLQLDRAIIRRGSTYENRANLSPIFFRNVVEKYAGTRLGQQEIYGEVLSDNPGALWKREWIDGHRVDFVPEQLDRVVVAIDPSVAGTLEEEDSVETIAKAGAEAGIIVAGRRGKEYFVIEDGSLMGSPLTWGKKAIQLYHKHMADLIVAEKNNGGVMVEMTLRGIDGSDIINIELVWASKGKQTRAEPIAALYEQGKVHHVRGFPQLEEQMCEWDPLMSGDSPDRLDALVWAISALAGIDDELREDDAGGYVEFWSDNDRENPNPIRGFDDLRIDTRLPY